MSRSSIDGACCYPIDGCSSSKYQSVIHGLMGKNWNGKMNIHHGGAKIDMLGRWERDRLAQPARHLPRLAGVGPQIVVRARLRSVAGVGVLALIGASCLLPNAER